MNDKQRLIDANKIPFKEYMGYDEGMVFEHEIEAMPAITPTPQWIPVTERLPKIYRDKYEELIPFLVCVKGTDYPFRAVFDGKNWGDGWYRIDDVIAWMPLPEPYKMDGKDGDGE